MADLGGIDRTLPALFQERARAAPEQVALISGDQAMSYGRLNREANRIAHYLRDVSGVRADDRVAILVRDPVRAIVAVLAALKAGGAYVPVDTDNPPAATKQVLDEAGAVALVLESAEVKNAAFFTGDLFITDVMADELDTPVTDPEPACAPGSLAYAIFTSGTTGVPKGVAVEHAAITNTLTWRNRYYGFGPGSITLAIPRLSYDSSVADIFSMLTSGGTLVLPERDRLTDRRYLAGLIERWGVTNFLVTPALYKRLIGGLGGDGSPSLRTVTLAGEWFTRDLVQEHYRRLPRVALHNEYGPAENAVCSTACRLDAADPDVLIGQPIDNTIAFAVTDDGEIAGPGQAGELYLAGAGLARGYLGRPEFTAERFFQRTVPGGRRERVYQTGDVVRVHPGGAFQFLGRTDNQVKIRGRRVELDHVAARLSAGPDVTDVFVLHYVPPSAAPVLLAFFTGPADADELASLAAAELPAHMVPAAVIGVGEIPIGKNGKVDADALIGEYLASAADKAGTAGSAACASAAENSLLTLWRRLFPHLQVDLDHDFFFDLGGDSLLAMELVNSLEEVSAVRIATTDVYEARTIRQLAVLIGGSDEQ